MLTARKPLIVISSDTKATKTINNSAVHMTGWLVGLSAQIGHIVPWRKLKFVKKLVPWGTDGRLPLI